MRIVGEAVAFHPQKQGVLVFPPMRIMDPLAAPFRTRLHAPAVGTDARQVDRRLRPGVLSRQRLLEVCRGSRVALRNHLRTDLHRGLVQPTTGELDTGDLPQH